ncbi:MULTISPECIES: response regulator transcription factor [Bacillaceae]|uniref:response regulator transcription factor n=1 Tax=Metabacillus halosaccharovorans TaxID=930124 RepID=UPI000C80BFD2|nr:response regulator transcription factor [Metabacillus halosaccharovorans]MCM3441487.1 response regulator transcription factor [Metabacillus halosaccharovorans]PMC36336.1 DNA-binding response regulator [Bacillus sp. UMB0899]
MKKTILIVDDEWNMRNLLSIILSNEYDVIEAKDGEEALRIIKKTELDLIILDLMMPFMNGWEVCAEVRKFNSTPILMLTARNELKDRVHGLDIGADDYIIKPFEPEELLARIKAVLRRTTNKSELNEEVITFGSNILVIDNESRNVTIEGEPIDLTPKEFIILSTLATNPKRVFTREILLEILWGINDSRETRTVDTHIKNIRVKIKESGSNYDPIGTVWGVGYRFNDPEVSV